MSGLLSLDILEADDSLTLERLPKYIEAANYVSDMLAAQNDVPTKIKIWKGRLLVIGASKTGYVVPVFCPTCPHSKGHQDAREDTT